MKIQLAFLLSLIVSVPSTAQKVEKPKVHADFQFGSLPTWAKGHEMLSEEQARLILVAYHEGWSLDKLAKELQLTLNDVAATSDTVEDANLAGRRNSYEIRPFMPVIREQDWAKVKDGLQKHSQQLAQLLRNRWPEIENAVAQLNPDSPLPKGRLMYEMVVGSILFGGMLDAFFEDKTMMPPPPRRDGNDRYFGWLVESNPGAAGLLRRDLRESAGYRIISIGTELPTERLEAPELKQSSSVYEGPAARQYRIFVATFTRDNLLPYFKEQRSDFLKLAALPSSRNYVAFAETFAWFYSVVAHAAVDNLAAAGLVTPPEKFYTYAIQAPQ